MADPLSVTASAVGILGFTAEIVKLLSDYISSAKSASQGAQALRTEIEMSQDVMRRLIDFLQTDGDEINSTFVDGSILVSALVQCQQSVTRLYKTFGRLSQLRKASRAAAVIESLKWPFKKGDYEKDMDTLRRLRQVFQLSLNVSSWSV
jgi:hypothetical protein